MEASQVWLRASLSRVVCVIRAAPDFGRLKRERLAASVIHPLADRVRESSAATLLLKMAASVGSRYVTQQLSRRTVRLRVSWTASWSRATAAPSPML